MNYLTRIAIIAALLPALAWAQGAEQQAPAAPVKVEKAQRDTFSATLWVSGTVIARNDARIAAETDGRITWVADVGSRIAKGEAVARIDAGDLKLQLADSEARLESLKSQMTYRDSSLKRLKALAANNNASATQLDEAQSQLDMTRQEIKRAEVAIAQIKRRIAQTEVLAPFPGVVAARLVQLGEFVNRGAQVARLVDTENREIRAQAPLSVVGWIREGMQVTIEHAQVESLSPVSYVIPVGDERSRMFEVRIAAENPAWVIGSPVRVALPNSEPRELVAIPRDGLVLRGQNIFVMRVNDDNTVERVVVETGIGLGGFVEVIGEVEKGDRIVTRGGERLQPGQVVSIADS
jgi:RND family efflux transporter MFP subunit